jgi:hypothetical protein
VLPSVAHHCAESTVNRKLAALSASNQHAGRHGVELGELRTTWQPAGRWGTGWKLFLHHISKGQPQSGRALGLKAPRKLPRVLAVVAMAALSGVQGGEQGLPVRGAEAGARVPPGPRGTDGDTGSAARRCSRARCRHPDPHQRETRPRTATQPRCHTTRTPPHPGASRPFRSLKQHSSSRD